MSDTRLRELERQAATGSVDERINLAGAMIRAGKFSEDETRIAAMLGHAICSPTSSVVIGRNAIPNG